jgi:hypothetical protein
VGSVRDTLTTKRAHADRGAACDGRAARARPGLAAEGYQFRSSSAAASLRSTLQRSGCDYTPR